VLVLAGDAPHELSGASVLLDSGMWMEFHVGPQDPEGSAIMVARRRAGKVVVVR